MAENLTEHWFCCEQKPNSSASTMCKHNFEQAVLRLHKNLSTDLAAVSYGMQF